MMSWFVPKEAKFFEMFNNSCNLIVDGAKEMNEMLADLSLIEVKTKKIKDFERQADKMAHKTIEELHATFITPLDREDMYQLIGKIDDIMDYIDAVSQRFYLYDIRSITPEIKELASIILRSMEKVREAVAGLENMKTSKQTLQVCVEINQLENDADHVMRLGMSKLFREDINFKDLIKMKEVIELLEEVTDRCKEVSNIVEGIVLDHA